MHVFCELAILGSFFSVVPMLIEATFELLASLPNIDLRTFLAYLWLSNYHQRLEQISWSRCS